MSKTYWVLATTSENFEISRELGFKVQGVESSQRRKAARFSEDDRIIFYLSDRRVFAASATVTSEQFEDHSVIWKHHRESEVFPHRFHLKPDVVLKDDRMIDAREVGPRLDYVRKWPPEDWYLAFFGPLHIIPARDFNYLEEEMKRAAARRTQTRSGRKRRGRRRGGRQRSRASRNDQENGAQSADVSDSSGAEPVRAHTNERGGSEGASHAERDSPEPQEPSTSAADDRRSGE